MTTRAFAFAVVLSAAIVAAQQEPPKPVPKPVPQDPAPDPAQVKQAEALLQKHGERSRDVKVLVADYEQRRTTALTKDPLVSRGRFLFVREPACVVFRASEPRVSEVRLAGATYEVHRPASKQLERFHLEGPELAQGLFAAVGGDVQRLLADFRIAQAAAEPVKAKEPTRVQIRLVPTTELVRERLQELIVTLHEKDGALAAVAYRDLGGDLVEIRLSNVESNPKEPPPATLDVGADTRIVDHPPAKKRPG